jgi:hypothetical protein
MADAKTKIHLQNCRYDIVKQTASKLGYQMVSNDEEWDIFWMDTGVALDRVLAVQVTSFIFYGLYSPFKSSTTSQACMKYAKKALWPEI